MAVISASGLIKTYRRPSWVGARTHVVRALDDVTISLRRGEAVGVIGESGSGKSTLARLILGMERPDAGSVCFGNDDIWRMGSRERRALRRSIQVVFQDPLSSLNPRMRVAKVVAEPLRAVMGMSSSDAANRVRESLIEVGLSGDVLRRYPHEFSGGQRQRIAIARAIAVKPAFLILDEPISSLDVSIGAQILELIETIRERYETGYLLISHNLAHVRNVVQRVVVMRNGAVLEHGQTEDVFLRPQHEYTQKLLEASPRLDLDRNRARTPVGSAALEASAEAARTVPGGATW